MSIGDIVYLPSGNMYRIKKIHNNILTCIKINTEEKETRQKPFCNTRVIHKDKVL